MTIGFGVCAVVIAALVWALNRERRRRKGRGFLDAWPLPLTPIEVFNARFQAGPLGPSGETEIRFIGDHHVEGGISDFETWVICNLAKGARRIFEFGTCTGKTTYLMAANAPDATVTTLTLTPAEFEAYQKAAGDKSASRAAARRESDFVRFYYTGTDEAARIEQLYGDSKALETAPRRGQMDLIFVDGSHARSYVESDTAKALEMLAPGGVILWHDYHGPERARGVFEALNALSGKLPLVHLRGTSLAAYRAPAER